MILVKVKILYRRKASGFVAHNGLELRFSCGSSQVFHNSPGTGPCITSFEGFAQGEAVNEKGSFEGNLTAIWMRIQSILTKNRRYDALSYNCEHAVREVIHGERFSPQLKSSVASGLFFGLVTALFGGSAKQIVMATAIGAGGGLLIERTHQLA
ncbi:hypothetical protein [Pseudoteredinibacter isoporae]|uniref:LRAT domain-containing protein n=1 Tax=Pseudoteredinibacter isoporae TaxID=570281 RepID=A0A7X0JVZ5_9GAMM|nr:hypothetical protein [Pseudoteredinibacter isoporae]MBB6522291.1 hypothetical protein [Pseudoteredinibacter isoporae]NHO87824.1 hypothetical protein [Pseudoteredinibacter isoporae]NIB23845.1 hypothetical protein [Pseudoteredinibacter isoporae]